jgi:hypothetical protein
VRVSETYEFGDAYPAMYPELMEIVPADGVTEYVPTDVGTVALGSYDVPFIPAYEKVSELTVPVSLPTNPLKVERGEYWAVGL